jgi:hypothetical protein
VIEITHIKAQVLRGLLTRVGNLLSTVESADSSFVKARDAAIRDCEQTTEFLLKRMMESSPELTQHYTDSASEKHP